MPSPAERWTPASATDFALRALECAREIRSSKEEAHPIAFLLIQGGIVPVAGIGSMPGHQRGPFLRRAATELRAQFVVHVYEAWLAEADGEEAQAAIAAHRAAGGEIRTYDGRKEVLLCSADGPGLSRLWSCPILPDGTAGEARDFLPEGGTWTGNVANLAGRQGEN